MNDLENKLLLKMLRSESGWAIVSTMIAIVIGLIMLAGIFVMVKQANDNQKAEQMLTSLRSMQMCVRQIYAPEATYLGLTNDVVRNAQCAFTLDGGAPGVLRTSWGGTVTVTGGVMTRRFAVTLFRVPRAACVKLATMPDWESIAVNGTIVSDLTTATNTCLSLASGSTMSYISN